MADSARPRRRHSESILLNVTPVQKTEIERAADDAGKSVSDFLRDAAMLLVEDIRERKWQREDRKAERSRAPQIPVYQRRYRREESSVPASPVSPPPVATPTVIVQTGAPPSAASRVEDVVDFLASYVLSAEGSALDAPLRASRVAEMIRVAARDEAEAERIAALLDRRVGDRRAGARPEDGSQEGSWLSKIAGLAGLTPAHRERG